MSKKFDKNSYKCQEAIRLKYMGETYPVIAQKLKVSIAALNSWFCFGGLLRDEYEQYRDGQNEVLNDLCDESLARNIHTAGSMLVALMGSADDNVKFRAVKEMLDRVRGTPKANNDQQGLLGSDLSYEEILKKARARPP